MRIVWKSHFKSGEFGKISTSAVTALNKMGVDIHIVDVSDQFNLIKNPLNLKKLETEVIQKNDIYIQNLHPRKTHSSESKYNFLYTELKSKDVPDEWIKSMSSFNHVFVPSVWNKNILINHGLKNISVIPYIVNYASTEVFVEPLAIKNKKTFSFLSIVDLLHMTGLETLLTAFWTEFRKDEDVGLILQINQPSYSKRNHKNIIELINSIKKSLNITAVPQTLLYDHPLPDSLMASLYRSSNVFVFPACDNGFGIQCAEAMALGIPVIAPNYGGLTDYATFNNCELVGVTEEIKINIPSLRESMRKVYVHYNDFLDKAIKAKETVKNNFSEIKIGVQLLEAIENGII